MVKTDGPIPHAPITGHRGATTLDFKWTMSTDHSTGNRIIEGIAYNAAIKGERRRVTCSDKTWYEGNDDVFYWDEAIRWTVDELKGMDMRGTPIRMMHEEEEDLPAVGKVCHNFVDDNGDLHIVAELFADTKLGKRAIEMMDEGICEEISIGYPLHRDKFTQQVYHSGVDEFSLVDVAHFRGCRVGVKASDHSDNKRKEGPRTIYRVVRASKRGEFVFFHFRIWGAIRVFEK